MKQDEAARWTISEVAKASKVSSRTLRHYDQMGLLEPAHTGLNGYRFYGQQELLRLQRILLLRDLGLGLETIGEVLDGQADPVEALAVHKEWLLAERDRLDRMSRTVDATIAALRQGENMTAENIFKDFDNNPYEAEARQRWGDQAVDASNARHAAMTLDQKQAFMEDYAAVNEDLARCLDAALPADDPAVQAAVERHYAWICLSWTPSAESYVGLGQMYVDDPRFTANYDKVRPGLASYLLEGIKIYAAEKLS
ncbi:MULTISPECIES: MerR family transcriptional regulator [Arthrobacter]|uniref:MerR family transcriptional regulator n=1 Tax=Arthrobacter terricola TaxID=2547396 RepID=A0A4R5KD53_9MICC|nr:MULTISPECIES: MerR family transcriptional regulator [Arthrobacter]MBT8162486.1 MerR family transcriptional regulator [Arthrobacter sp. GN70]TDF93116.1 MerR family transcriptional regulator [Arthrobacter terricola]